jgi:hypothetical protein
MMGVDVDKVEQSFDAQLELVKDLKPQAPVFPTPARGFYLMDPGSNAPFMAVTKLQAANVPVARATTGDEMAPGTWIVPVTADSTRILTDVSRATGMKVTTGERVSGDVYRLKPNTRIGLWRGANVMPAGWLKWLFEQYGFNHKAIASTDFQSALATQYDTIVLPDGTSRQTIVNGLNPQRNDKEFAWAYGVGEDGWKKLGDWVRGGGTLVAIGSAVETARALLDLPIEASLPEPRAGGRGSAGSGQAPSTSSGQAPSTGSGQASSTGSGQAAAPLQFYCPGSLLQNEFNTNHPVAFGMPATWPVFFEGDQAYRLKPGFTIQSEAVSRYPVKGPILQSGWLLGEEFLRDQANVVAFRVGKGYVVTMGSQIDFRTQPRGTFKLLFNAMFHGPSTRVPATTMSTD